jgi:hypothetical protein
MVAGQSKAPAMSAELRMEQRPLLLMKLESEAV